MNFVRPDINRIAGYIPGEQPQETGWIKLNTNENPYPPSPRVMEAIEKTATARLGIYPDPLSRRFSRAVAELFDVDPDGVLPGNGSDEILTICVRTFVDAGETISFPYPSYVLYETLAGIQGATARALPLNSDWSWNHAAVAETVASSKLVFVPNPNSPSGNRWDDEDLLKLIPPRGLLLLDEAYTDFCDRPHRAEILKTEPGRNIVVSRTLSKSYSLAGIRVGFAIADPSLIAAMRKVKDSYNCNTLSLAAATAAIEDQQWMQQNVARIQQTRQVLSSQLMQLGFDVVPSQANFVWATHPQGRHGELYESLKKKKILVRFMQFPPTAACTKTAGSPGDSTIDGLRITVGTDEEIGSFLHELRTII